MFTNGNKFWFMSKTLVIHIHLKNRFVGSDKSWRTRSVSLPQVRDKHTDTYSKAKTWLHSRLKHCVFRSSPARDICPRLDPKNFHSDDEDEK